ncbi:MAG: hypothetical protein GWN84_22855 [Gammaproteobacteria bacterium]|nr:hypothetical protein [Gammaproteobacteria bacterium]NIR85449.1 hypothetical protein [Gammaproteobacteria bacterium]NIR89501.1 hypothetical protein [Gammaproteobacteria bacterium]NIU06586.1 hypothetical protein [Gammaproteobacteria bacterium]NIV53469.1 hypothetical protein [Gammaproteobacteria bacterium]
MLVLLLGVRAGLAAEDAAAERAPQDTHSVAHFRTVVFELPLTQGVRDWCRAHNKQYADDLRAGRRGSEEKLDYCASWDGRRSVCYITLRYGLSRPQQERVLGDAVAHCAVNADREIRRGT